MNKSLKAAIGVCVVATALFVVGFTSVYVLESPDRLHWCNLPEVLNCTTISTNQGRSDDPTITEADPTQMAPSPLQTTYTDIYTVRYNISGCSIETDIELIDTLPCEFRLGGRALDNGVVCYITPDCQFDQYRAGVILTIMVLSSFMTATALLAFVATLLLKFVPYLYLPKKPELPIIPADP